MTNKEHHNPYQNQANNTQHELSEAERAYQEQLHLKAQRQRELEILRREVLPKLLTTLQQELLLLANVSQFLEKTTKVRRVSKQRVKVRGGLIPKYEEQDKVEVVEVSLGGCISPQKTAESAFLVLRDTSNLNYAYEDIRRIIRITPSFNDDKLSFVVEVTDGLQQLIKVPLISIENVIKDWGYDKGYMAEERRIRGYDLTLGRGFGYSADKVIIEGPEKVIHQDKDDKTHYNPYYGPMITTGPYEESSYRTYAAQTGVWFHEETPSQLLNEYTATGLNEEIFGQLRQILSKVTAELIKRQQSLEGLRGAFMDRRDLAVSPERHSF